MEVHVCRWIGPLADPRFNVRGHTPSLLSLSSLPSLSSFLPSILLLSLSFPSPLSPFLAPLISRTPWLRLGNLGDLLSSPSRSGSGSGRRFPAAKHILVHFRHKFAPFLVPKWLRISCVCSPLKECGNYWELCIYFFVKTTVWFHYFLSV